MAGGYEPTPQGIAAVRALFEQLRTRVAELERPTGTQRVGLIAQVEAKLAELDVTVNALVAAALGNYYTKTQTDSKVASPGAIGPTDVSASGQVTSAQPLRSPGSFSYTPTTGYKTLWIDGVTFQIGNVPSTLRVKKDLEAFPDALADAALALTPYLGHYIWDEEESPLKVFLIAEDVAAAGFGTDVVPTDADGAPDTLNYSQLVVPLLAVAKRQHSEIEGMKSTIADLTSRLDAAGI